MPLRYGSCRRGRPSCGRYTRASTPRPSPAGSRRCCRVGRSCWQPVRMLVCTSAPRPMRCASTARPVTCFPGWMASRARSGQLTNPGPPASSWGFCLPLAVFSSCPDLQQPLRKVSLCARHCSGCFGCVRIHFRLGLRCFLPSILYGCSHWPPCGQVTVRPGQDQEKAVRPFVTVNKADAAT